MARRDPLFSVRGEGGKTSKGGGTAYAKATELGEKRAPSGNHKLWAGIQRRTGWKEGAWKHFSVSRPWGEGGRKAFILTEHLFVCALVAQSCPTLCDPVDCSPMGSSVHGILQARILEWVAILFPRGVFLTQGSNPVLLHCREILYHLSHQGSLYLVPDFL